MACMHRYHKECITRYQEATGRELRYACPLKCLWEDVQILPVELAPWWDPPDEDETDSDSSGSD